MTDWSGYRVCSLPTRDDCPRTYELPLEDPDGWREVDGVWRCPACVAAAAEQREGEGLNTIGEASQAAFATLGEQLEAAGGKLLMGFVVVIAEGVTPNGGVFFAADEEDGPTDPQEVVDFALGGLAEFAKAQGIPIAVMDVPGSPGGQG